jgi:hypothetical protein
MTDLETMKRVLANQQDFTASAVRHDYKSMLVTDQPERLVQGDYGRIYLILSACIVAGLLWLGA